MAYELLLSFMQARYQKKSPQTRLSRAGREKTKWTLFSEKF
jgi:hypothetical protein